MIVMDTNSVTNAAELLETSSSSVSHAINKMNEVFNNSLFIRIKSALEPTSLALTITMNLTQR
ncbi:helix-turn-helix domain-containing protein [Buttiauxella massiliensis]|uniref:helix-turn-helix domain-containing protein n=1 Tax=Buttiauxella massiliensis TaxID=2831590 RepID=UPI001D0322B6|nr:LysR family transcriptional regulator [Buttiauxella massiliensis]